jgi:carboxylesterase type B
MVSRNRLVSMQFIDLQFPGPADPTRAFTTALYNTPAPTEDEDCLYLNVFTPTTPAPPGGFAVMFWLYGGGALQFGSSSMPIYDASTFAANENIIIITSNYRSSSK